MPRFNFIKNSFLAGELSPAAHGRTDLPQHAHGCKRLYNAVGLLAGGARNRAGAQFLNTCSAQTRLIPFVRSATESYVVEITTSTLKVFNAQTGVPCTVTTSAGFTLGAASYLSEVQFAQSVDVMWLVHETVLPYKLERTATNNFTLKTILTGLVTSGIYDQFPYRTANTSAITFTPSATAVGAATVTRSGLVAWGSTYEGMVFRLTTAGTTGWFQITSITGDFTANIQILATLGGTGASSDWAECSWNGVRGYPRTVAFFGDRILFGGNTAEPDTLWASQYASYAVMRRPDTGATNDSALSVVLNARQYNSIQWMAAKERLAIGTLGNEYTIDSLSSGSSAFGTVVRTSHGSALVNTETVFNTVLFVDRSARKIREMIYDYTSASYVCTDLSFWADHLPGKTEGVPASIIQIAWQASAGVLWCVDDSGGLFSMTRDRQQGVLSWQHHELGGVGSNGGSKPFVYSVACVPGASGHDDVFVSVLRTTDAGSFRTVEVMRRHFDIDSITNVTAVGLAKSCVFLDCAMIFNTGSAVTSVTFPTVYPGGGAVSISPALTDLNGQTFAVFGDGYYLGTATVTAGALTLPGGASATQVVVGFPYRTIIEPLPIEAGAAIGSAQGAIKRIDRIAMRFYRTLGAKFGRDTDNLETIEFRTDSMPMGSQVPFFTGEKVLAFSAHPDEEATVVVVQDLPFPMTLCSIALRGDTRDS